MSKSKTKIITLDLIFSTAELPPLISIDPGSVNSAIVSTCPPKAIQINNDTEGKTLINILKAIFNSRYEKILIENFNFYAPRKYATQIPIIIGKILMLAEFYNLNTELVNKPKKMLASPMEYPHVQDAVNLLLKWLENKKIKIKLVDYYLTHHTDIF